LHAKTETANVGTGRILLSQTGTQRSEMFNRIPFATHLKSISDLVRRAYEPGPSIIPATANPSVLNVNHSPSQVSAKTSASLAGFRKPKTVEVADAVPRCPIKRPDMSNLNAFVIIGKQTIPGTSQLSSSASILEREIFDDSCCFINDAACNRCILGSPTQTITRTPTQTATFASIKGQKLIEDIAPGTALDSTVASQTRIGNSGLKAIGISHSKPVSTATITANAVYRSIKSFAVVVGKIIKPLFGISDAIQLNRKMENIHGTIRAAIWPTHLGRILNTWGICL
jgi:hypothetical protein